MAKIFRESKDRVTSMDFSANGEMMITCGLDDRILMYDCQKGDHSTTVHTKKYGARIIRFTHGNTTAIYASSKVNHDIRYISLHDNRFIRYFKGHSKQVNSLSISPIDDTFVSTALDGTLRLWDLRSETVAAVLQTKGKSLAAFDPQGLIFATGINSNTINLYDLKSLARGPFLKFCYPVDNNCEWTEMKFSRNGKFILIGTNGKVARMVDAFNGVPLQTFGGNLLN